MRRGRCGRAAEAGPGRLEEPAPLRCRARQRYHGRAPGGLLLTAEPRFPFGGDCSGVCRGRRGDRAAGGRRRRDPRENPAFVLGGAGGDAGPPGRRREGRTRYTGPDAFGNLKIGSREPGAGVPRTGPIRGAGCALRRQKETAFATPLPVPLGTRGLRRANAAEEI